MGLFERITSAVSGAIPVEDDLDMEDSQRVRNLPQSDDPNDAVPEAEARSKANAAQSDAEDYADGEIENHRQDETHARAQPPQTHGNGAHTSNYLTNAPVDSVNGQTGDVSIEGVSRQVFTSDGTWSNPGGNRTAIIVAVGGGGGGGGSSVTGQGGGGGGGGVMKAAIPVSNLPESVSVSVGEGGVGGVTNNTTPGDGGDSSFGSILVAPGGDGAVNFSNGAAGAGGSPDSSNYASSATGGGGGEAGSTGESKTFAPGGGGSGSAGGASAVFGDGGDGGSAGEVPGGGGSGRGGFGDGLPGARGVVIVTVV